MFFRVLGIFLSFFLLPLLAPAVKDVCKTQQYFELVYKRVVKLFHLLVKEHVTHSTITGLNNRELSRGGFGEFKMNR